MSPWTPSILLWTSCVLGWTPKKTLFSYSGRSHPQIQPEHRREYLVALAMLDDPQLCLSRNHHARTMTQCRHLED